MAKQLPPQVQAALLWSKSNLIVVVFSAIVLVVPVGSYFAAKEFRAGIETEAKKRATVFNDLRSTVDARVALPLPGGEEFPLPGLPNASTVSEYEGLLSKVSADAQAVYAKAVEFNRGRGAIAADRAIVPAGIFPAYKRSQRTERESVRLKFVDALQARYADLLASCRVGRPPEAAGVGAAVMAAEKRIIQGQLKQESRAKLDAEQLAALERQLGRARIEQYFETAKKISFYVDPQAFPVPTRADANAALGGPADSPAALDRQDAALFQWQWNYWVVSDVLRAFAAANASTPAVLKAPVKRVIRISPALPKVEAGGSGGGSAGGLAGLDGSGMSGDGMTAEGTTDGSGSGDGSTPPPSNTGVPDVLLGTPAIDPKAAAPRDFATALTGRVSNSVYDVVVTEVVFVAETAELPKVFDALAAHNLMTVTNVRVAPADPFTDARDGYLYGPEPVSLVTATIETIWLREWTAPFMPAVVRTALRVPSAQPGAGDGTDSNPEMGME